RKTARNAALWQNPDRTKKPETQGWRDAEAYAVRLANHILTALTVLQNRKDPILHRDIKPANLFLRKIDPAKEDGGCENYDFYLGDFGIARILDDMVTNVTTAGTQVYMAPELVRGKADESSDLYSLGIILYQIVNHWRTPFMSGTGAKENIQQEAYVRRMQAEEIPAPDGCSPEFAKFILKLCQFYPEERYANAKEALLELNRILYGGSDEKTKTEEPRKRNEAEAETRKNELLRVEKPSFEKPEENGNVRAEPQKAAKYTKDILWQEEGRKKGRFIEAIIIAAAVIAAAAVLLSTHSLGDIGGSGKETASASSEEAAALSGSGSMGQSSSPASEDASDTMDSASGSEDISEASSSASDLSDTEEDPLLSDINVTQLRDMTRTGDGRYEDAENIRNTLGIRYREAYIHCGDNLTFELNKEYARFITYVSCYDWDGDDMMLYVYLNDSNDPVYQLSVDKDMEPTLVDIDLKGADTVTLYLDVDGDYINNAVMYKAAFYKTDESAEAFLAEEKEEAEKPVTVETTALENMPFIQGKTGISKRSNINPVSDKKDINGKIYREALQLDGDSNTYYVNRKYKRFVAQWICKTMASSGAELNIYLDNSNEPVYSEPMTEDMDLALIDVDISDAKFMTIDLDVHGNYISDALMINAYLYATDEEADDAVKNLSGD
ncbi:MAG: protein kinase, partial [Roseburia faecis]|nr:protein kinase [Roseburia faecis]